MGILTWLKQTNFTAEQAQMADAERRAKAGKQQTIAQGAMAGAKAAMKAEAKAHARAAGRQLMRSLFR